MFMGTKLNAEELSILKVSIIDLQNAMKKLKQKNQPFQSLHNLQFEERPNPRYKGHREYKVGTIHGIYFNTHTSLNITAVFNDEPGNGHFEDLLQWFERSCKREKMNLVFMHCDNLKFKEHLLNKRGFLPMPGTVNNVIKIIN